MIDLKHRLEWVDPASLGENPRNWKTHPADQLAAIGGLIDEVGWVDPIIYNALTDRIINGHGRKQLAIERGIAAVPVVVVELDPAQEAKALAAFDTVGIGAVVDPALFADLLRDVDTGTPELMALLAGVAEGFGAVGLGDDGPAEGGDDDRPDPAAEPPAPDPRAVFDTVFPSDNEWGVPRLDPRWSAPGVVFPAVIWGSVGRKRHAGTVVLYTDDERFQALWSDPSVVLDSTPTVVIEPNYSTHEQMPDAVVLWHTYQKRWVARYLQSKGIATFVDLNVSAKPSHRRINLLGVPREWRAFATRSHKNAADLDDDFRMAADHAGTEDLVFLVYGGSTAARDVCAARGWSWLPEQSDEARGRAMPPITPPPPPPTPESPGASQAPPPASPGAPAPGAPRSPIPPSATSRAAPSAITSTRRPVGCRCGTRPPPASR